MDSAEKEEKPFQLSEDTESSFQQADHTDEK